MVAGSRAEGGVSGIPSNHRKMVMSIKEIVRNHSEAEIYAVLKESNMDPDETAQKLLNQDPFHEVKKKRDKKKENVGLGNSNESRKHMSATPFMNNQASSDWNMRKGPYTRSTPGISHEFRVVRDNRANQITNGDAKQGTCHTVACNNEQVRTKRVDRSSESRSDQRHPLVSQSDGRSQAFGTKPSASDMGHARGRHPDAGNQCPVVRNATLSKNNVESQEVENAPSTPTSSRSAFGVYSSSSDPVHVPSNSKAAGIVGAIKRDVGVVGKRTASQSPVSSNLLPSPSVKRDAPISAESSEQNVAISKNTSLQQPSTSDRVIAGNSVRTFSSNQHAIKQNPQSTGHQKGTQSTMEWKPKLVKKPSIATGVNGQILSPRSTHNDSTTQTSVEGTFSAKLSEVNIHENEHVIIPKHLRVPEAERVQVTFGSFGVASDTSNDAVAVLTSAKNLEDSVNESVSMVASAHEVSNGDAVVDRVDFVEDQSANYRSESPGSPSHSGKPATDNVDSCTMENYGDIGLVPSHNHSQTSPEPRDMQTPPNLPTLSEAYDIQQNYEVPFLRERIEDNMQTQGLGSLPEVSSNAASSSPPASVPVLTHQPPSHQPVTPMYPQLQFSHFPNYLPYHRQILSPMFVPPMAMPTNYTTNPAYPHPSNGSSYLLMPGASSHLSAGGMKFAASQFKPAAAGNATAYGNYTSPAGYAISSPGTVASATGLEDISRVKYKDNNSIYVQNPQAETSEVWIQNPRDMAGMQSTHYYNVPPGQAPHATYLPTHAGHAAPFNAAVQPSHVQFPGLYHHPQPAAMANPHHLVHQQVPPSIGGNAGVGMSAPGQQVGSYQQPQLGHLNWSSSF